MIEIDGSTGVGGGQIVRTALALSLCTQQPIRLSNVRAGRSNPGLRPQHLAAVRAASAIGRADVSKVEEGTTEFSFVPSSVAPGRYSFDVGTAGSVVLVLQTILPPLLTARAPSTITVTGGTHVRSAPVFEFFRWAYIPVVQRMGPVLRTSLAQHGFYPRGGGTCTLEVEPTSELVSLDLTERGRELRRRLHVIIANLPDHIAERERDAVMDGLSDSIDQTKIHRPTSASAGNALILELVFENVTEVFSVMGEKGTPAEQVAMSLVDEVRRYLDRQAPVGPYLADQLLLPLALGGGTIRATTLTAHTHTNATVIQEMLGDCFSVTEEAGGWRIAVDDPEVPIGGA